MSVIFERRLPPRWEKATPAEKAAVRKLSTVERATVRARIVHDGAPSTVGVLALVAQRLHALDDRRPLEFMSGQALADIAQQIVAPGGFPSGGRRESIYTGHRPGRHSAPAGWAALAELDRLSDAYGVSITLSTPDPDDERRFVRLRLHKRMAALRSG
jgi:hypothetical protein